MADGVYTIAETRASLMLDEDEPDAGPVKVSPVLDETWNRYKPDVRFPWNRHKKAKQRTPEEIEEQRRGILKKKKMVTIDALNLAPVRLAIEQEIQEKLELFEKNIYRSVSYCYHKQGVYESRAEAIAKTYAIRQLP